MKRRISEKEQEKIYCLNGPTTLSNTKAKYGNLSQKPKAEAERDYLNL